jgi:hypothetical protein
MGNNRMVLRRRKTERHLRENYSSATLSSTKLRQGQRERDYWEDQDVRG